MGTNLEKLQAVRTAVRKLLEQSEAFEALPQDERRGIARDLVTVSSYLADPGWLAEDTPARADALAESQAVGQLKERLAQASGQVGQDFQAGGVREGVRAFDQLVKTVDFPAFVSGLIQGVFKAVVDASMEQMKAYGELLAAVTKSVEDFAADNISEGNVRDHLANRYPSLVVVDTSGDQAKLKTKDGVDDTSEIAKQFGLQHVDLSDEISELALVNAAKLEMARSRQQMLATMVLLGINRIVVTNGRINAKVVFDMKASDQAARQTAKATLHDQSKTEVGVVVVASPWSVNASGSTSSHVATVQSAVDDQSESKASVKAQLSGDVRLSFKSETFPLERMADMGALTNINQKAGPAGTLPAQPVGTPQKSASMRMHRA